MEERWVCGRCGCTVVKRAEYRYSAMKSGVKPVEVTAGKDRLNFPCGCFTRIWPAVDEAAA